ncbi:MAG: hypothetical protein HC771_08695 [Synechococcales cyanobacterium CRU_2_2]|nr:hypothetical protein [Synechococcales cyanobacterium CRU_2_2]
MLAGLGVACAIAFAATGEANMVAGDDLRLRIPPGASERRGKLFLWSGGEDDLPKVCCRR